MKFSSEFNCLGLACPHTCCSGEIKLSVLDLIRLNPEFKEGSYYLGSAMIKVFFDHRSGLPYGLFVNKGGFCPLLKDGLCKFYDKRPLVCRAYPIMIFYPEVAELELNSGCKGVSGMKWEYVSKDSIDPEVTEEFKQYKRLIVSMTRVSMGELAGQVMKGKLLDYIKGKLL